MVNTESGYELIRKIANKEVKKLHLIEYGRVESVDIHSSELDGNNYTCSVLLIGRTTDDGKPLKLENVTIATSATGNIIVPYIDDLVLITYINGDFEMPVVIGKIYTSEKKAPIYENGDHKLTFDPKRYQSKSRKVVNRRIIEFLGFNEKNEYRIEFRNGPVIDYTPKQIQLSAGKSIITIKQNGNIEISTDKIMKFSTASDAIIKCKTARIEVESKAEIKCKSCKIDASAKIELGTNGTGIVTEGTHKCYFTGAPPVGSRSVKAKN